MSTLHEVQKEVNLQIVRDYAKDLGIHNMPFKMMCFFGLAEEAGEVVGLMKRVMRSFPKDKDQTTKERFIEELGDVLWYLAACCTIQDTSLEEVWQYNKKKLEERYGRS